MHFKRKLLILTSIMLSPTIRQVKICPEIWLERNFVLKIPKSNEIQNLHIMHRYLVFGSDNPIEWFDEKAFSYQFQKYILTC